MTRSGALFTAAAAATLAGCGAYGVQDYVHFEPQVRVPGRWSVESERAGTTSDIAAVRMKDAGVEVRVRAPDPAVTGGVAYVVVVLVPILPGGHAEHPTLRLFVPVEVYCPPTGSCEVSPLWVKIASAGTAEIAYNDASLASDGRAPIAPGTWKTFNFQVTVETTADGFELLLDRALTVDGNAIATPPVGMKMRRVPRPYTRLVNP